MRTLAIGLVGVVCCLGAETASADTFCVAPDTSCTPAANNKATIQDALATALRSLAKR